MGHLIRLSEHRTAVSPRPRSAGRARTHAGGGPLARVARIGPTPARPSFFFDLACPFSYLAAERVERLLGAPEWLPVPGSALARPATGPGLRAEAERRAAELRLPLVWPERGVAPVPGALRAAAYAAEAGAGSRFATAALRMRFCGGYDLDDPEVLAEIAAASGLAPDDCLAAAADTTRDRDLYATASGLRMYGIRALPAISLAGRVRPAEAVFAERILAPSAAELSAS